MARGVTPARLFLDGPATSYSTADLLRLRSDHAAARDAVHASLEIDDPALAPLVQEHGLFAVRTLATSLRQYLAYPHLGRALDETSRDTVSHLCPSDVDLQIVLGDGLSPRAVARYGPQIFDLLVATASRHGWSVGRPIYVSRCRVGIMNDIGDLVRPTAIVLLIGERPGLATAESMSAYLGYKPRSGHTDADRNLICNIHNKGVSCTEAAPRIFDLVRQLRTYGVGGISVKEAMPASHRPNIGAPPPA